MLQPIFATQLRLGQICLIILPFLEDSIASSMFAFAFTMGCESPVRPRDLRLAYPPFSLISNFGNAQLTVNAWYEKREHESGISVLVIFFISLIYLFQARLKIDWSRI